MFAIEGAGAYGAGLCRQLMDAGERVLEVERPGQPSGRRRRTGKDDRQDALAAARQVLSGEALAHPRTGAGREALRVLLAVREGAVGSRAASLNQLRALVVTGPESLRERLAGLTERRLLDTCLALRRPAGADVAMAATVVALVALARRIRDLDAEITSHERAIRDGVRELCPVLLEQYGVGPIGAGELLVGYSHPGRIRSEAALARPSGVAPIPASSGQTERHRLHRGGDRRLNRTLYRIVECRLRRDGATRDYLARRLSEGKTKKEAIRCLKRYVARQLFRLMEASMAA